MRIRAEKDLIALNETVLKMTKNNNTQLQTSSMSVSELSQSQEEVKKGARNQEASRERAGKSEDRLMIQAEDNSLSVISMSS
jgi:hypothetical protein